MEPLEPLAGKRRKLAKAESGSEAPDDEGVKEEHVPEGEEEAGSSSPSQAPEAMAVMRRVMEHHRCPITQQLPVDPVMAEDGHIYERSALKRWLARKLTSPTTNRPMGCAVVPAVTARQTVNELVEGGVLGPDTLMRFFSERGRMRATRTASPGPDLDGAKKDLRRSLNLAVSEEQRSAAEFQLAAVSWMQDGVALSQQARQAGASADDLRGWMLEAAEAARVAVTSALLQERRLLKWRPLPKGALVRVLDDVSELQRLCEEPPPEAELKVGWNAAMATFAGKRCMVQRVGSKCHGNYILRREDPPHERDFSFPYNALFVL
mmetsp:Transcript_615/g.1707  ORF Transcript_615/g.1707 Transcript_615/m.1707 type:complete len:321 (+) Transcript_615:102-1064(+)